MSPGSSVISRERWATRSGTEKIRSSLEADCIVSPFRSSENESRSWGPASSGVTSQGPLGAEPSKTLPGIHWGVANCRSRAERSLSRVKPARWSMASSAATPLALLPITKASSAS